MGVLTSSQYLEGIQKKDPRLLNEIYKQFRPMIAKLIENNGGNSVDAEDIFQDALSIIYLQIQEKGLTITTQFSTYLYAVAKWQWFNKLRRKKFTSGVTIDDPMILSREADAELDLEKSERYLLYRKKFETLGVDCRNILTLTLIEDLDYKAVAHKLGLASEGYARKKKHECKEKLVKAIREDASFVELKN